MKLSDGKNTLYFVGAVAAGMALYEAVKIGGYVKKRLTDGTFNPASPNNAIYDDISNDPTLPFNGSLGVWIWEKLHPESKLPAFTPKKRGATGNW